MHHFSTCIALNMNVHSQLAVPVCSKQVLTVFWFRLNKWCLGNVPDINLLLIWHQYQHKQLLTYLG
jgi:hypothetical protein